MTKELINNNIDFKELSKNCKDERDLSNLTKEFMKNMIEKMLESEIEGDIPKKLCLNAKIIAKNHRIFS
jgi:hypothetical protein